MSGLPHSPKTVKNLNPIIEILLLVESNLAISSLFFFDKP